MAELACNQGGIVMGVPRCVEVNPVVGVTSFVKAILAAALHRVSMVSHLPHCVSIEVIGL